VKALKARQGLIIAGFLILAISLLLSVMPKYEREIVYVPSKEVRWETTQILSLEWGSRVKYAIDMASGEELHIQFSTGMGPMTVKKTSPMLPSILFFVESSDGKVLYSSDYTGEFQGFFIAPKDGEYKVYFQNDLKEQPNEKIVIFKMEILTQKNMEVEVRDVRRFGADSLTLSLAIVFALACVISALFYPSRAGFLSRLAHLVKGA